MKKARLKPLVKFLDYDNLWKSVHINCGSKVSPRLHSIKAGGNCCRKCGFRQSVIKRTTKTDVVIDELRSVGFEPLVQFRGVRIGWKSKCLKWKQIRVLGTSQDKQLPFFIEWKSLYHPSTDGKAIAKIVKVETAGDLVRIEEWLGSDLKIALVSKVQWLTTTNTEG